MSKQALPKGVICPQYGRKTTKSAKSRARQSFNGKRWREDMRNAIQDKNWDRVSWLEHNYDFIINS